MTNSTLLLKIGIFMLLLGLGSISLILWYKTPHLFEYFNQAFCAH